MSFCSRCGKRLDESACFCSECGTPVKQTKIQSEVNEELYGSSIIVKYEKSALYMALKEPLNVNLDGELNFKLVDGHEICYNIAQGNHTISAYVPYIAGTKYGSAEKSFYVGSNETWEITYRPQMSIFTPGSISIRRRS